MAEANNALMNELKNWVIETFTPTFHDKRLSKTFGDLLVGLLKASRTEIANIGREIDRPALAKHKIKCADRFLGNERAKVSTILTHLVALAVSKLTNHLMYISIDWTDCNDGRFQRLMASVNCHGRSLPVYWITVSKDLLAGAMTETEQQLLRTLRQLIPSHIQVVILADRGFAKVELLRLMDEFHLGYIYRCKSHCFVEGDHFRGPLFCLPTPKGTRHDFGRVLFTRQHQYPLRVVAFRGPTQQETWFLITNLRGEVAAIASQYAHRMEIEETFKDIKNVRRGWQLRGLELSTAGRQDRMMLLLAVAYTWVTLAGMWAEDQGIARTYVASSTHRRAIALWRAGLTALRKGEVVTLQVLASYMTALGYSGEGPNTAAA